MKEKKFIIEKRPIPARARNKRRRTEGTSGGGSTVVSVTSGGSAADPNSHTHENKYYLDQISTDADDYLYLKQGHKVIDPETGEEDTVVKKNKVKSGFADEAHKLSPDSPTRKEFLSRLNDDVAKGKITFEQMVKILGLAIIGGVHSGDAEGNDTFEPGGLTGKGFGLYTDGNGDTNLEVDNIVARRKFMVNVLEIQKETYAGGNINLTQAHGTVFRVYGYDADGYASVTMLGAKDAEGNMVVLSVSDADEQAFVGHPVTGVAAGRPSWYKLYFMREDEEVTVDDMWHTGDMALMKTLNLSRGQRAWHRVVTGHGVEQLEDGREYNYIIVSDSDDAIDVTSEDGLVTVHGVKAYDDTLADSEPLVGDKVVQVGSVTEAARMGVTRIDSRGDGFGGMYVVEGIGKNIGSAAQFRPTREPIVISPKRVHIDADDISFVTRDEKGEIVSSDDVGNMISSIDMKADSIKLKVGLDGGRNLLKGTKHLDSENIVLAPESQGGATYRDFTTANNSAGPTGYSDVITYHKLRLQPSTVYVLSFMYLSNPGTSFETYIYNADVKVCEYVRNNQTKEKTSAPDGHSHFDVKAGGSWVRGSVEFRTTAEITDETDVTVIVGRLMPIAGTVNFGNFCAPKIEYGAEATQWRPSDEDSVTDGNLLDTGIDIKNKRIIITSDRVVVRNNAGVETLLLDGNGHITAALIDAVKMVADVLAAEKVAANNMVIGGASQFGNFITDEAGDIVNNADVESRSVRLGTGAISWLKRTASGIIQEVTAGWRNLSQLGETGMYVRLQSPVTSLKRLIGQYIEVARTPAGHHDSRPNAALWIESGNVVGLRPRVRRVGSGRVQLSRYDYTVLLTSAEHTDVVLPPTGEVEDGQRIEIRACACSDNSVSADTVLSDSSKVVRGETNVYIYDEVNREWWVNKLN